MKKEGVFLFSILIIFAGLKFVSADLGSAEIYVGGHEVGLFDDITSECMETLRTKKILFGHTSTGAMIISGMQSLPSMYNIEDDSGLLRCKNIYNQAGGMEQCLALMDVSDFDGINLVDYFQTGYTERITEFDLAIRNTYGSFLNSNGGTGFIFLSAESGANDYTGFFNLYNQIFSDLEQDYLDINYVYWSPALYGAAYDTTTNTRSKQMYNLIYPAYYQNKPFYDLYDIQSTRSQTPAGQECIKDADGNYNYAECECTYNYGGGPVKVMCQEYLSPDGYHPGSAAGKERMAKAMMVLLAKTYCWQDVTPSQCSITSAYWQVA